MYLRCLVQLHAHNTWDSHGRKESIAQQMPGWYQSQSEGLSTLSATSHRLSAINSKSSFLHPIDSAWPFWSEVRYVEIKTITGPRSRGGFLLTPTDRHWADRDPCHYRVQRYFCNGLADRHGSLRPQRRRAAKTPRPLLRPAFLRILASTG